MAVVIRLQGLPIVAGTMDIRHFFSGLTIPDGGVHIVGGEHGEAFIVFATDEDARLGMMRTGGAIKGSKVSLLLSSKTEMQNTIELSRRRFEPTPAEAPPAGTRPSVAAPPSASPSAPQRPAQFAAPAPAQETKAPLNMAAAFPPSFSSAPSYSSASTLTTALASLNPPLAALPNMALPPMPSLPPPSVPPVPPMSHLAHMSPLPPFNPALPPPLGAPNPLLFNPMTPLPSPLPSPLAPLGLHMKAVSNPPPVSAPLTPDDLVLSVQNLPYSCSEAELRDFFRGVAVEGVRFVRDAQGRSTGRALVRFFSAQDSYEALKRGGGHLGQRYVEVSPASERQWNGAGEKGAEPQERGRPAQGGAPRDQRGRSRSPHRQDLCVYLKGLPYEVDKNQVKEFFKNLSVVEDSMYIAYGANGKATGEGFVEFVTEQDYKAALGAHMQYMGARFIQVHPITRKGMMDKIQQIRKRDSDAKNADATRAPKTCVHITNIPYNVSRKDVRGFLEGLGLYEDSLKVLTDAHGNGLGQAVVQLRSDEDARKAERLHRQKLNGRDAFVHLVTYEHMKEVERNPPPQNKRGQRPALGQAPPPSHLTPPPAHLGPPPGHAFGALADDFGFIRNPTPFAPPFSAPGNGLAHPPSRPWAPPWAWGRTSASRPPWCPGCPRPPSTRRASGRRLRSARTRGASSPSTGAKRPTATMATPPRDTAPRPPPSPPTPPSAEPRPPRPVPAPTAARPW